ncbi:hypothetical protein NBE98_09835 [Clostridium swellfunianum]|uniref:hypothetical protein n=1 Tax=Clostridium swellfunianum TaxID=1367462 RepID=UPI00203045AA|nr:hypothetical protein [Clostridium swellfunianum]MCM0648674.1 hypothetical protein [Clostridium swellfunianum]
MNKKRIYGVRLAALAILLFILSICSLAKFYTKDKPLKMIYKLRENEGTVEVAKRFNVDPKTIKYDGGYLIFEVK